MANTDNIITQMRRKNASGFDTPFFIGSAAKYITGIRGTNVNNIEENMLIGVDCISTEEVLQGDVIHLTIEYRDEDTTKNYYILDSYEYKEYSSDKRYFSGEKLMLPLDSNDNDYQDETLLGIDLNTYSILDNNIFNIINNEEPVSPIICEQTLKFVNNEGNTISVAKKTIYAKYTEDGKTIQKQVIQNLL